MAKKQANYQTLNTELDNILVALQKSDIQVDEAVNLYDRGIKVIEQLEEYFEQAQNKLTKLRAQSTLSKKNG